VVNFVKALGRKATSAAALAGQLQGQARPGAPGAAGRPVCCAVAALPGLLEVPPGLAQDRAAALVLGAREWVQGAGVCMTWAGGCARPAWPDAQRCSPAALSHWRARAGHFWEHSAVPPLLNACASQRPGAAPTSVLFCSERPQPHPRTRPAAGPAALGGDAALRGGAAGAHAARGRRAQRVPRARAPGGRAGAPERELCAAERRRGRRRRGAAARADHRARPEARQAEEAAQGQGMTPRQACSGLPCTCVHLDPEARCAAPAGARARARAEIAEPMALCRARVPVCEA
jgi:hypothetical protein